jgi:hypothetical protein
MLQLGDFKLKRCTFDKPAMLIVSSNKRTVIVHIAATRMNFFVMINQPDCQAPVSHFFLEI